MSAWVMSPDGFFVRAVCGGPVNSEIVQTISGGDGQRRVRLTASAAERGYRLVEEVFAAAYAGKKTDDGQPLGPALFKIWSECQAEGQAGLYPDEKLPPPVLEARKKWAARAAAKAPAVDKLDALLRKGGGA